MVAPAKAGEFTFYRPASQGFAAERTLRAFIAATSTHHHSINSETPHHRKTPEPANRCDSVLCRKKQRTHK
ncbi:hypothetical protein C1X65_00975 [Pseudomonas sp. FW305-70]|nr:hypothetical protein C1X65_00975 [Pseudomonas sp. FW305-70]